MNHIEFGGAFRLLSWQERTFDSDETAVVTYHTHHRRACSTATDDDDEQRTSIQYGCRPRLYMALETCQTCRPTAGRWADNTGGPGARSPARRLRAPSRRSRRRRRTPSSRTIFARCAAACRTCIVSSRCSSRGKTARTPVSPRGRQGTTRRCRRDRRAIRAATAEARTARRRRGPSATGCYRPSIPRPTHVMMTRSAVYRESRACCWASSRRRFIWCLVSTGVLSPPRGGRRASEGTEQRSGLRPFVLFWPVEMGWSAFCSRDRIAE